jgi:hypothetical protein
MKKITLFIAALAVAFSAFGAGEWAGGLTDGGNAKLGTYDPATNVFTENEDVTQIKYFDQHNFSFAIRIDEPSVVGILDANPNYTVLLNAVRLGNDLGGQFSNANGSWGAPYTNYPVMTRVNDATDADGFGFEEAYVFYIEGCNLGALSNILGEIPVDYAAGSDIHTNMVISNPTLEENVAESMAAAGIEDWMTYWGARPGGTYLGYCYLGNFRPEEGNTIYTDVKTPGADGAGEPTGFFNLLGQELNAAPEKGVYIETYADAPAKKVVKP